MYFIAFTVFTSAKTRKNPGRNKDSENIHLGRNRTRRTEYTPLERSLTVSATDSMCDAKFAVVDMITPKSLVCDFSSMTVPTLDV